MGLRGPNGKKTDGERARRDREKKREVTGDRGSLHFLDMIDNLAALAIFSQAGLVACNPG